MQVKKTNTKDYSPFLKKILKNRNLKKEEEIEDFLNPKWSLEEEKYNPFLLKDMEKSSKRILKAIEKKEYILIYSDYDTDGIPGGALLHDFFKKINYKNFSNFIPNRNLDGYGLSLPCLEKIIKEKKPDLIITVDCGITDIEEADFLKKEKIDLIITDHHEPKKKLPKAYAIIDHKQKDCSYPEKILCGCGLAFKLVQALNKKNKESKKNILPDLPEGYEKWFLDLVAISTICDMVPLVGENRLFVKYGFIVLSKTQREGLLNIFKKARLDKNNLSADDVAFYIGPRINAASRLEDPKIAFLALCGETSAKEASDNLEKINNRRKTLTAKIMKNVWKRIEENDKKNRKVIVIGDESWPLGMLGLISGKISDREKKPSFVWTKTASEKIKGSARSGGKKSVLSLMEKTSDFFTHFGGHHASGGFETDFSKIHFLEKEIGKNFSSAEKFKVGKIKTEEEISLDEVNIRNFNEIKKLEPFGVENPKPIFLFKNIKIKNRRFFGKNSDHIEISFLSPKKFTLKAISFSYAEKFPSLNLEKIEKINLYASFDGNFWNGNVYLRLKIENIEEC